MNVSALCPGKLAFKTRSLNLPDPNIYSHVYARICLVHWLELSKRKPTFGCNHAFIDRNVFSLCISEWGRKSQTVFCSPLKFSSWVCKMKKLCCFLLNHWYLHRTSLQSCWHIRKTTAKLQKVTSRWVPLFSICYAQLVNFDWLFP